MRVLGQYLEVVVAKEMSGTRTWNRGKTAHAAVTVTDATCHSRADSGRTQVNLCKISVYRTFVKALCPVAVSFFSPRAL